MVAASTTHSGMAAWRCCAAVEAAAVQGNKPWRRAGRDRCVLWVCTGRVGRVGCARDVRDALMRSGAWGARGTCGAPGTPGVCRWRRRSSAYVGGVVTEHGATGVSALGQVRGGATGVDAPGRVRRLGHVRDDDNDKSCNNNGRQRASVKIKEEIVRDNLGMKDRRVAWRMVRPSMGEAAGSWAVCWLHAWLLAACMCASRVVR
ncbi:hypothetical protein VPH35_077310 [Triticum aestivum]